MKKHVIKIGYYANLAFESAKDATAAYEILSKGTLCSQEYVNSLSAYVLTPDESNPELSQMEYLSKDQLEFLKEKEKEKEKENAS